MALVTLPIEIHVKRGYYGYHHQPITSNCWACVSFMDKVYDYCLIIKYILYINLYQPNMGNIYVLNTMYWPRFLVDNIKVKIKSQSEGFVKYSC